ncbi:MAG: hypothetical protein K2X28_06770 [Alphaproteobacteria bacterium]|nr:hypothetical protein [Alphaproteobacteria bacterium]
MKVLILKKFWVFLLPLTFLISSGVNTNADVLRLISVLTDEEVRIIHRALNNKCQVDWKKEFKLNTPNREGKTRKVLDFLTTVYAMKIEKSKREVFDYFQSFYAEESSVSDPSKSQYKKFMEDRWQDKQRKLESGEATLKGLLRNSKQDDFGTFECFIIDTDETFRDFVILGGEGATIISQELRIEPVLEIFTPVSTSSSLSSSSSSSSSSVASSSAPSTLASSTSLADISEEAEELLLILDKKSAKIALQARLNNYQIPFAEFNFSVSEETEQCINVVNYLNFILERKTKKVLDKQTGLSPASPAYQFYCKKHTGYQKISEDMWTSYMGNEVSLPALHPVSSSSRSKSSRGI